MVMFVLPRFPMHPLCFYLTTLDTHKKTGFTMAATSKVTIDAIESGKSGDIGRKVVHRLADPDSSSSPSPSPLASSSRPHLARRPCRRHRRAHPGRPRPRGGRYPVLPACTPQATPAQHQAGRVGGQRAGVGHARQWQRQGVRAVESNRAREAGGRRPVGPAGGGGLGAGPRGPGGGDGGGRGRGERRWRKRWWWAG